VTGVESCISFHSILAKILGFHYLVLARFLVFTYYRGPSVGNS
jgi:hypothetical protein